MGNHKKLALAELECILLGYPTNHPERIKIEKQKRRLKSKDQKGR